MSITCDSTGVDKPIEGDTIIAAPSFLRSPSGNVICVWRSMLALCVLVVPLLVTVVVTSRPAQAADGSPPYTIACSANSEIGGNACKVDKKTYIGWRTYHAFCHVCHAQDAVGSTFAPSLVETLKIINKGRFLNAVADGYTGQIGVMPAWKENPNVSKRYDELYAYLKARADGTLPPGRPQRLDR